MGATLQQQETQQEQQPQQVSTPQQVVQTITTQQSLKQGMWGLGLQVQEKNLQLMDNFCLIVLLMLALLNLQHSMVCFSVLISPQTGQAAQQKPTEEIYLLLLDKVLLIPMAIHLKLTGIITFPYLPVAQTKDYG